MFKSPAGTIVQTTKGGKGMGVVTAQLRKNPDARVKFRVTWRDEDGNVRSGEIYGKGGRRASDVLDDWGHDGDWIESIADDLDSEYGGSGGVAAIVSIQAVII